MEVTYQTLLRDYLIEKGHKVTQAFESGHSDLELIVITLNEGDENILYFQTINSEVIILPIVKNSNLPYGGGWKTVGYLYDPDCFKRVDKFIENVKQGSDLTQFEFYG